MEARIGWLLALCMSLLLAPLPAQDGKFSLTAAFEPATAKPGDEVELVLRATVAQHWHAYGSLETVNIPVALKPDNLVLNGLEVVGAANVPPGIPTPGPIGTQYPLPNTFRVVQKLRVPDGVSGKVTVEGELNYQICDESACEPPSKAEFTATLDVQGQGGGEPAKKEPLPMPDLGFKPGLTLDPDTRVVVKATFEPDTARPGEHVTLVLRAVTQDGWHAYGWREAEREFGQTPVGLDQTAQDVGDLEFVGEPVIPPGEPHEVFGETQYQLGHEFEVRQVLRVPEGAEAGNVKVGGVMIYQVCNDTGSSCEPEAEAEYETVLHVEAGEVRDVYREPPTTQSTGGGDEPADGGTTPVVDEPPTADEDDDNPFGKSWWALILACIGGGLFALAMPCTYPMIPITFSFFTKQSEKFGGKVWLLSIVYGLGIIAMFVAVGALLSAVIIDVVNHWITNAIIGVAFFFFAFVLFGWINLNPPQWMNRLAAGATQKASSGQGGVGFVGALGALAGVFFMGATLVITSFTCTAPIVGSLIANVAKFGTLRVAVGMAVFGLTMAVPFMFLSMAPGKVKAMPKAGQWMDTLKISLGFVELAAAFKFVSMVDFAFGWQILPRELFLMLWAAIFAMWAMFLFGILRKAGTVNEGVGNGRMAAGMAVTLLAAYFLFGALGNRLDSIMTGFVPGYSNSLVAKGGGPKKHPYELIKDDPELAMQVARKQDKLLLYNFTGFN